MTPSTIRIALVAPLHIHHQTTVISCFGVCPGLGEKKLVSIANMFLHPKISRSIDKLQVPQARYLMLVPRFELVQAVVDARPAQSSLRDWFSRMNSQFFQSQSLANENKKSTHPILQIPNDKLALTSLWVGSDPPNCAKSASMISKLSSISTSHLELGSTSTECPLG